MSEPDLLILDEPTKGFDPVNRRLLLDVLDDQKRLGTTVVMVTHQMDEVERLCDRIILLKDGRAEAYGTVAAVQESFGGATVRMNFEGEIPDSSDYTVLRRDADYAELDIAEGVEPAKILQSLVIAGVSVSQFTTSRRSLEEIFLEIYGESRHTVMP